MITSSHRRRLLFISLVLFLLFSLLVARFYTIQILQGEEWLKQANKQHTFIVKEPFKRGTFYSNTFLKKGHPTDLHPFAIDVPKYHLYVDVESIPSEKKEEIIEYLVGYLSLPVKERQHLTEQFDKKSRSRKLAMWLDKGMYRAINSWWSHYSKSQHLPRNALFFVKDYRRSYPFGKLLGQVLHTIQKNKEELTQQAVPTGGLELYFNHYLQGKQGKKRLMRSPRNSLETGEMISYPEHGADIYLTINPYVQSIMEDEIEIGVKKCKAKSGWAVMMDPKTGEILGLAQYPFFYPPDYELYFNDPQRIEQTKVKAITDANEPGSVFKPFTVTLALKANQLLRQKGERELFSPEEKIATSNGYFPGRSKPITDTHLHHYLNMNMGIQKSSNIYMGRLAERIIARLGPDWYRSQLQQIFGIGSKTGIELPAESAGVLPTPGKKHPNGTFEWSIPTPYSLAIGHNVQVTSLQLLRAWAVFANGGFLVEPTLVKKIVKKDEDGKEIVLLDQSSTDRIKRFPRVLDSHITNQIVKAIKYVTKPGGTSVKADIPGYTEAGKSSTAKKIINGSYSETLYCASFIGFAPVENPAFLLIVTMDEPEYGYIPGVGKNHNGGNCSATVFRETAKRTLEYLGIPPDDPYGYPAGDPRRNANKADWVNETRQLQEIYDKWNNSAQNSKQKS